VDWDWELAGVTLVGLAAGAALVVFARGDVLPHEPAPPLRVGLAALTAGLSLLALAAVLATVPLSRAHAAYSRQDYALAADEAKKATDWAPWSAEALNALGRAQLALGQVRRARASFADAVARSPNEWELRRDLAAVLPAAQARAELRRAIALNPLDSELRGLLRQLES
jgi:tetratricopeptide (TPR) repeat protein